MDAITLNYKLLPKQMEFVKAKEKQVLFSGGMGSGKSFAICCKLLQQALVPHSFNLLTRKTLSSLKSSTLRTLLIGEKDCPPVLPQGSYDYSESKGIIKIYNAGEIFVCGCDDPIKIRSINASSICVDEMCELDEDEYIALLSRIRNSASFNRQLFGATNPSSQNHHLYKRFFTGKEDVRVITSTVYDNKHLSSDYIKQQEQLTGVNFKRYVMANWCNNEGAVYKEFNTELHIKEKDINNYTSFIISLDIGFTDPSVILVTGYNDDSLHVFEETYTNELTPTDIANKIKDLQSIYPNNKVVIDRSAKGTITQAESMGVNVIGSNSDIDGGILRLKELLIKNKLTISRKCIETIKEFDLYSYNEKKDKPIDKWSHCMDSLRYMTNLYYDAKGNIISPNIYFTDDGKGNEDKNIEKETEEQRISRIFEEQDDQDQD